MYEPREDSELLKKQLEGLDLQNKKFLEVGAGKGILGVKAAEKAASVTLTDIDQEAVDFLKDKTAERENIKVKKSNLFENIDRKFNFIFFNPPYLPGDRESAKDPLKGGGEGTEVISRFLEGLDQYLHEEGEAYFILSSKSNIDELDRKFDFEIVDSKELWFETLYVAKSG